MTQVPAEMDREDEQQVLEMEQLMNDVILQCLEAMFDVEVLEIGHFLRITERKHYELDDLALEMNQSKIDEQD